MDCDFNPAQVAKMQPRRDSTGAIVTDTNGAMVWEAVKVDPAMAAYQHAMEAWRSEPGQDPTTMPQYVPSPVEEWVPVMSSEYKLRYLKSDGSEISKEAYETSKTANEPVYRAAFVGCTYHCG